MLNTLMADQPPNDHPLQDRRVQSLVHDLDKRVATLELTSKLELSNMSGRIDHLSLTSATSIGMKALEDNLCLKLDSVHKDVGRMEAGITGIKNTLFWIGGLVVAAVIAALLKQVLVQ